MAVDDKSQSETSARQGTHRFTWLARVAALLPAVLFAAHPVLTLFQENQSELPLSVIWRPLAVTFLAAIVLCVVLGLIFKSWQKAGALTALAVLAFFYFDTFGVVGLVVCAVVAVLI